MAINIKKIVENIAIRYSQSTILSTKDDIEQDIWVYLLERNPQDDKKAVLMSGDCAKKVYKKDKRISSIVSPIDPSNIDDDGDFLHLSIPVSQEDVILLETIKTLPDRERTFAIAKWYLSTGLDYLESEFSKLYQSLPEERKQAVIAAKNPDDNDFIFKVFLGIRSGSKSKAARTIKKRIKTKLVENIE